MVLVKAISMRELKRSGSLAVEEVLESRRPVLITRRGKPVAVLLAIDPAKLQAHLLDDAPEYVWRSDSEG